MRHGHYIRSNLREIGLAAVACGALVALCATATAQDRPYDGIQAGLDAFRLGEEKRRADVEQQAYLNDQMKIWAGLPTARGEAVFYYPEYYAPQYYSAQYRAPLAFSAFEPWPYVPGDIWGYRYYTPVRQPVGQWQGQTGPNRWESHPVYDPPVAPSRPLPSVDSPLLDRTPYASPPRAEVEYVPAEGDSLPPPPPKPASPTRRFGPREF